MSALYVIRTRKPDGSWTIDLDMQMSKREAELERKKLRIYFGISTQLWTLKEAQQVFAGSSEITGSAS